MTEVFIPDKKDKDGTTGASQAKRTSAVLVYSWEWQCTTGAAVVARYQKDNTLLYHYNRRSHIIRHEEELALAGKY